MGGTGWLGDPHLWDSCDQLMEKGLSPAPASATGPGVNPTPLSPLSHPHRDADYHRLHLGSASLLPVPPGEEWAQGPGGTSGLGQREFREPTSDLGVLLMF